MTKSTITREQLEEWVAQFDEDGGCDATDRQLEALIRQSLAAMDSEPVGSISIDRLLQLLYQFDGANECAASIGDQEYALECGDVASALRELLSCRSALPVADVVAWSNPNEERKCDIRWRRHDVEPGPLYRHAQPAPVVVPNGLRLALSNAGIAAPESDEMLAATCEKHIQALVTWVKDRKPFQSAPVVPDAYVRDESGRMMLNGVCEPKIGFGTGWNACRAAMLQASNSPAQSDCCPAQNHVSPEQNSVSPAQSPIDHGYRPECECSGCKATARICAELSANSTANPDCWCRTCRPVTLNDMRFVVCPDCGNKRCPRANDHRNACTGSNEPGQEGSAYPDTPREVK